MRIGGVGMAHIATDADGAAELVGVVEDFLTLLDEAFGVGLPDLEVAALKLAYVSPC